MKAAAPCVIWCPWPRPYCSTTHLHIHLLPGEAAFTRLPSSSETTPAGDTGRRKRRGSVRSSIGSVTSCPRTQSPHWRYSGISRKMTRAAKEATNTPAPRVSPWRRRNSRLTSPPEATPLWVSGVNPFLSWGVSCSRWGVEVMLGVGHRTRCRISKWVQSMVMEVGMNDYGGS